MIAYFEVLTASTYQTYCRREQISFGLQTSIQCVAGICTGSQRPRIMKKRSLGNIAEAQFQLVKSQLHRHTRICINTILYLISVGTAVVM